MNETILIVDDKSSVQRMVAEYIGEHGFRTLTANNGREALYVARHEKPDLILLDIMMPEMDGYEFIRTYRKERDTPIIIITAKLEETDQVLGLELGADDYVTKPFGMAALVARIRAVLRRIQGDPRPADVLRVGDLMLDKSSRDVRVGEQRVDLTPSEFDLLAILLAHPGQVFSRTELLERLKGNSLEGVERTIDVHIRNLRGKIEADSANPRYIMTVFGVGYRLDDEQDG